MIDSLGSYFPLMASVMPSFDTVVVATAGGGILYGLRTLDKKLSMLNEVRDKSLQTWTAIYGEEKTNQPTGLIHEAAAVRGQMTQLSTDFTAHVAKETVWQTQFSDNAHAVANRTQVALGEIHGIVNSRLDRALEEIQRLSGEVKTLHHQQRKR